MMVTLRNDFHNSQTRVRLGESGKLTQCQVERARRALCGVPTCLCSGPLGTRGPQDVAITISYNAFGDAVFALWPNDEIQDWEPITPSVLDTHTVLE